MEKSIIVFTIFVYLFFTISTVTIASDETSLPTEHEPKTTPTTESVPESETTQVFDLKTIDPPRMIINPHFYENTRIPLRFPKGHPCKNKFKKMFMIHDDVQNNYNKNKNNKRVVSYGNDMVLTDLTTTPFDVEKFPTKRFEFKRKYGHRHHHHHENEEEFAESKHRHHHHHENEEEFAESKHRHHHHHHENEEEFAESKYERKEKTKERKGGFMRGFRKFLKHTFD